MLDRQKKMEIIRCLQSIQEMPQEELEQLLDAELAKPEAEIDTELVQSLLDLLEGEMLDSERLAEQQQKSWKQIQGKISKRSWSSVVSWIARGAAVVAIIIALLFATYQTAEALHWRALLRWMQPFAEIFTLYSDSIPETELVQPQPEADDPTTYEGRQIYGDGPIASTRQPIIDYADAPERLHGYPAKAEGIPARFVYEQGSVFSDARMTVAEYVFTSGDEVCLFKVRIPTGTDENPSVYHYEITINETMETYVDTTRVTYYFNADCMLLSSSWMVSDVQYLLFGNLDQAEMEAIIHATIAK